MIDEISGEFGHHGAVQGPMSVIEAALAEDAEAVVREAIGNAVRHAGATKLIVAIDVADELSIDIVDNGKGISDNITGSGLIGLRQRAEMVEAVSPSEPARGVAPGCGGPLPST